MHACCMKMAAEGNSLELELKFGGQKYDISLAASSTLRDLFNAVSRATDVEPESLKIIHKGKSLSYDETSLADVRMANGAKLMALGRKGGAAAAEEEGPVIKEIAQRSKEVDKLEKMLRELQAEGDGIVKGFLQASLVESAKKKLHKGALGVSEAMMKTLEALDGMEIGEKDSVPRARRKTVVQRIQVLLKEVDEVLALSHTQEC